ncbi:MAG TPA: hypothetical protein VGF75_01680 [Candidatus Saccharimonadales bacterium]
MGAANNKIEIPTGLPLDPPGSELRERLKSAYDECAENCVYLALEERDWHDHDASTALFVIGDTRSRIDLPGLRDVIRNAFLEHSSDRRFSLLGRMDFCFEGDPDHGDEHAIVALQALWRFGPRDLIVPAESSS